MAIHIRTDKTKLNTTAKKGLRSACLIIIILLLFCMIKEVSFFHTSLKLPNAGIFQVNSKFNESTLNEPDKNSIQALFGINHGAFLDNDEMLEIASNRTSTNCTPIDGFCGTSGSDGTPSFCQVHKKNDHPVVSNSSDALTTKCKTLWFAGMSERVFETTEAIIQKSTTSNFSSLPFLGSYQNYYMLALETLVARGQKRHIETHGKHTNFEDIGHGALQPVLLLNAFDRRKNSSIEASFIAQFAESRGAIVIPVNRLSIQDTVNEMYHFSAQTNGHQVGPFLRLDIPYIVKKYGLLNYPGICKDQFVMYTDADVFFPNPISHHDLQKLKDQMVSSSATVMYGREFNKKPQIVNTGVMIMDLEKFSSEVPKMLQFGVGISKSKGNNTDPFPAFDQGWINAYFSHREKLGHRLRTMLPIHFNWKAYWGMSPSTLKDLKIIHFHGPKPGRLLEEIATCDVRKGPESKFWKAYKQLVREGVCCDQGYTSTFVLEQIGRIAEYLPFLKF